MKYRYEDEYYLLTLAKGEFINHTFEEFAEKNKIGSAWINGIGAIENPEIGYYSLEKKTYIKKKFFGEYELTSLIGNITLKESRCFSHTHITFSDTQYKVFGGHLFDAKITAAGEFIMMPGKENINRKMNLEIGLALWCFGENID